tara:strand:- start:286 stop:3159 length:2874 start_codon:yes stop_codon:yes gene_type:complete
MANSSTVSSGDLATATQYNNLRADILDTSSGHIHDGTNARSDGQFSLAVGGLPLISENTSDAVSNEVLRLRGDNATRADGDEIFMSFYLDDDGGNSHEFARITGEAVDVSNGSEDGQIRFGVSVAGTMTDVFTINSSTGGATSVSYEADSFTIKGEEGGAGILYLMADQGDDAGDEWKINIADGGVMTFGNDIASAGTFVSFITVTPHATTASSSVAFVGDVTVGDDLSLTSDSSVFNMGAGNDFTITHDGTTGATLAGTPITVNSTGALTLDSSTDITLDADGADVFLKDGGTLFGTLTNSSGELVIKSSSSGTTAATFSGANVTFAGTIGSGAITSTGIVTGTGFTAGNAVLAEAELELLDGLTAGTAIASKVVTTDANIDTSGQRNLTITGELDAATLDISGDADIDGTLEADAITVNGTTLAEYIADTVGAMVTSNTESGITVAYQDGDNTLDFTVGTLNQDTTGTAAIATTVTITDNENTNENNAIVFTSGGDLDGGNIGLESDGDLYYNPSTGTLTATAFAGALTGNVTGNASGTALTVTQAAQSAITSLGTLTTLTVDNVITNGTTIGHTDDTDLMTLADGSLTIAGNLLPSADDTHDLGSASAAWQDLFLEGDLTMTDAGTIATSAGALTITSAAAATWSTGAGVLTIDGDDGVVLQTGGSGNVVVKEILDVETYMAIGSGDGGLGPFNSKYTLNVDRNHEVTAGGAQIKIAGEMTLGSGATTQDYAHAMFGGGSGGIIINSGYTTGGGHPSISTLSLSEPNITVTSGSVVTAATLFIHDAPTEADNNYALLVDSGLARFDSGIVIGNVTTTTNQTIDDSANGSASTTLYIGNQTITTSSDSRIKKDIVDTEVNAVETLDKLRVVDFMWDDPTDIAPNNRNMRGQWTGMIAQEIVDVVPYIINAPRTEDGVIDYDDENTWMVDYQHLVPMLVKAVQELNQELQEIKGGS